MPKRPRQHQLETKSRLEFEQTLPERWIYRRKDDDDYGIDGEVEVFGKDERATGLQFLVQLKATDGKDRRKALAVSIPRDHATNYRSLALPVLMVRYVASDDVLYTRWFHSHDSYGSDESAKSLSFRWQDEDRWTETRPEELVAEAEAFLELRSVAVRLPMPIYLDVEAAEPWDVTRPEIEMALRLEADSRPDVIRIEPGEPEPGTGKLIVRADRLAVELARVTAATLHIDDTYDPGPGAVSLARDALAVAALAFAQVGQATIAGRLAGTYLPGSSFVAQPEALWTLSAEMSRARLVREALDLAETLDEADDPASQEASTWFTFPALHHGTSLAPDEVDRFREVLRRRIGRREQRGDRLESAREYQNLANHYRARAEPAEALDLYDEAARNDPEYEKRAHYWEERAGVLWGTHQYREAAEAYERALGLGGDSWLEALRADCLLFAGQYRSSLEAFDKYNSQHPPNNGRGAEWPLKQLVAETIVTDLGIDEQERDTRGAQGLVQEVAETDPAPAEAKETLSRALDHDALEPLAWFNIGYAFSIEGNNGEAAAAFRCAAVVAGSDPTAWALAFIYSVLSDATPGLVAALFATGRRLTSGEMIPTTVQLIREQDHDDSFPKEPLLEALNALDAELPLERDEGFQIRTLEAGGRVDTVDVPGATQRPPPARRTSPKMGRNDPCPCGSGKKYKKCHGAHAA